MKRDMIKKSILLTAVLSLGVLLIGGCAGTGSSKAPEVINKVTCTYNLGDIDGSEMIVVTSDLTVTTYTVYSDSSVNLFAGEIPGENECEMKESAITEEDWNRITDAINDNGFMKLPEELPKVEAYDGSTCYITVEAESGTHRSGGYCAGNGSGKEHSRFYEVKKVLYEFK